ncbi:MAG: hypothetical protein NUV77_04820 [Thermoguttaceae bacterium]|nr:hypothetical protein [Thermoguttaceae bacterium]
MASFDSPAPDQGRHCGACTACCTHLPVPAGILGPWGKPAGVPCRHVGPLGCRCYDRRPAMCIEFRCAWLADPGWPAAWRPDRSGLLCLREMLDCGLPGGLVYEVRSQALASPIASQILDEIQRTTSVLVTIDTHQNRRHLPGRWSAGPAEVRRMAS